MKSIQKILVILFVIVTSSAIAQPPGGGRPGGGRPGGNPEEMIEREKQTLYNKVENLTSDQKLLLDGIYEEFAVTLKENMEEMRENNDRESRREKMEALRKEKDNLIADVLDTEQFEIYQSISKKRRERREGNTN